MSILNVLAQALPTCKHKVVGWPQCGTQRCLICGQFRLYQIGRKPGAWMAERAIRMEAR